jgi:xanthine dehydrogenase accessory factor
MSTSDLAERAGELRRLRVPYVHARVVLAERPTSAKPGAEAIVLADGTIEGFVGGTCAESTVRAQSLALLDSGDSLLLRITPTVEAPGSVAGRLTVHNPCLSGGTLEIFLEPVRPAPVLLVVGDTPIANALRRLGGAMGYEAGSDPSHATAVVVASHGRDEEPTLRAALEHNTSYIGLVASHKRGESVLAELGMCSSHTSRVSTPAGLDIGARTPDEIALSILAEIVSRRPRPTARVINESDQQLNSTWGVGSASNADQSSTSSTVAVDPVCGMNVVMVDASLHLDLDEKRWWFCGSGCLRAFAASPNDYQTA